MKYIGAAISEKPTEMRGVVYIVKDRCKGCNLCIEFCPRHVLEESAEYNVKGHHFPKLKEDTNEIYCVNCGYCELICPEFAIFTRSKDNAKIKTAAKSSE
jgi:2-oxoglutarate ferredoxin oxidoreductase subunit delta